MVETEGGGLVVTLEERDLDYLANIYGTFADWIPSGNADLEEELRGDLESVAEYLCEADRIAIMLYDRGFSQQKIGEFLGVTQMSVSARMKNIKKRVAYFLQLRSSIEVISRVFRRMGLPDQDQMMVIRWLYGARQKELIPGQRQGYVSRLLINIREEAEDVFEGDVLVKIMHHRTSLRFLLPRNT